MWRAIGDRHHDSTGPFENSTTADRSGRWVIRVRQCVALGAPPAVKASYLRGDPGRRGGCVHGNLRGSRKSRRRHQRQTNRRSSPSILHRRLDHHAGTSQKRLSIVDTLVLARQILCLERATSDGTAARRQKNAHPTAGWAFDRR
jgi:hypothetical protein